MKISPRSLIALSALTTQLLLTNEPLLAADQLADEQLSRTARPSDIPTDPLTTQGSLAMDEASKLIDLMLSQPLEAYDRSTPILEAAVINKVLASAAEVCGKDANLVEISGSDVFFIGDIHGDIADLIKMVTHLNLLRQDEKAPPRGLLSALENGSTVVFLGDYVDRGANSVEVLTLVAALKIRFPAQVVLLRGNHEDSTISNLYGFNREVWTKYSKEKELILKNSHAFFASLPIAANVQVGQEIYFAVHGGPSFTAGSPLKDQQPQADLMGINLIERKNYPFIDGIENNFHKELLSNYLWSDPLDDSRSGLYSNSRGTGQFWGKDLSEKFCKDLGYKAIIRAHQLVYEGILRQHEDKVITVFSSSSYCGQSNHGGILRITSNNEDSSITKHTSEVWSKDEVLEYLFNSKAASQLTTETKPDAAKAPEYFGDSTPQS